MAGGAPSRHPRDVLPPDAAREGGAWSVARGVPAALGIANDAAATRVHAAVEAYVAASSTPAAGEVPVARSPAPVALVFARNASMAGDDSDLPLATPSAADENRDRFSGK